MICGLGVDIASAERFARWVDEPGMIDRFFNDAEKCTNKNSSYLQEHYAVRFAAKEAFGKALGTGIAGFNLCDVFIRNLPNGKPELMVQGSAEQKLKEMYGECKLHVSLSHEHDNVVAVVIIEK